MYMTTATAVVMSSDRHRASHIPLVPISSGSSMKEGIRKMKPHNNASIVAGHTFSIL